MKDLSPLTPEMINELGLGPEHLWFVKSLGEIFGPFETISLKNHLNSYPELLNDLYVKREHDEKWIGFWDQPLLSRRSTPKLHTIENYEGETYHVLIDGQKMGPLTFEQISHWIKDKICFSDDLISLDNGVSWNKIFTNEKFSSYFQSKAELPSSVEELQAHGEIFKNFKNHDEKENQSALASLVLGPKNIDQQLKVDDVALPVPPKFKVPYKAMGIVASVFIVLGLTLWSILKNPAQERMVLEEMDRAPAPRNRLRQRAPASFAPAQPSAPPQIEPRAQDRFRNPASTRRRHIPIIRDVHENDPREAVDTNDFPEVEADDKDNREVNLVKEPAQNADENSNEREPAMVEPKDEIAPQNEAPAEPQVEESGDF
jgi:hypothetical protein